MKGGNISDCVFIIYFAITVFKDGLKHTTFTRLEIKIQFDYMGKTTGGQRICTIVYIFNG